MALAPTDASLFRLPIEPARLAGPGALLSRDRRTRQKDPWHDAPLKCLRGTVFTTGEEPLKVFGAFLFVSVHSNPQQDFADLRNASFFTGSNLLKFRLQFRHQTESKESLLNHIANYSHQDFSFTT